MSTVDHKHIVTETGAAAGRLRGINHLVLITHEMEAGVRFYRDILGLKVVRTSPAFDRTRYIESGDTVQLEEARAAEPAFRRQYFFELANGDLFSLYEVPGAAPQFDMPIVPRLWPPPTERSKRVTQAAKLDHLAFDVPSREDVIWFQQRLRAYGVPVSDLVERKRDLRHAMFVKSIYFYDPSGNPLEIASLDLGDPEWDDYDCDDWLRDTSPVPSLLREAEEPA